LETACLENALVAIGQIPIGKKLFINVNPLLMVETTETCFTNSNSVNPDRIVFEITEHVKVQDFKLVSYACRMLKEKGFLIAIDDVGSGYDRLHSVAELKPDFIKIDRPIVSGAVKDKQYQAIVKYLVALGAEIKCLVIAEGIETTDELAMMKKLGVTLGQGFLFSKPVQLEEIQLKEIQTGADDLCRVKGL
jgi:EAL domain-containing protein (putative c-di-GMP-specific phosphodiesterase class I)